MKIKRQTLLDILSAVQPGLAVKEIIEQSQSFIFRDGSVTTYNDVISVSHPVDLEIEGAVKAAEFHKLLSKSTEEILDIDITENELRLKGKRTRAGIRLEMQINLPLDEVSYPEKWMKLPKSFITALKFCMFSASSDMTREILTCLKLEGGSVVSCDGFRLTEYTLPKGSSFKKLLLLPAPSVGHLVGYDPISYGITGGWAHFKTKEGLIFSCRTQEGAYPDVEGIKDFEGTATLTLPQGIGEMLERAQIFTEGDFTQDEVVEIQLKENQLFVKSSGDAGWIKERAKIEYEGDPISFLINPTFLKDSLGLLRTITVGEGRLKMEGESFIHVVMLCENTEGDD